MRSRGPERVERTRLLRFVIASVAKLARHPSLWGTALVQAGRLSRPGWWRRPPFVPVPDRDYLRFRLETQYGTSGLADGAADPEDLVTYLRWCRDGRALGRCRAA